jgi:hypothetical protein
MADAMKAQWSFRAAEARRRHIQNALGGCDVDFETLRGNPKTLVVTKNTRSFDALSEERARDLARLAALSRGEVGTRRASSHRPAR